MDLDAYIQRIIELHPEFTADEILEICQDRLAQMGSKTKESNKLPILLKYLSATFGVDFDATGMKKSTSRFKSIPKRLLQGSSERVWLPVVQIKNLSKQLWSTILFEDASLQILTGSKVAVIGRNGAWKSTLLKLILWREEADAGEIMLPKWIKIGFLSQDMFRENKERTVAEEMLTTLPDVTAHMQERLELQQRIAQNDPESLLLLERQTELSDRLIQHDGFVLYDLQTTILQAFGFSDAQLQFPLRQLSGGEQTKVQIAKFLLQQVDLLIFDEPTNHLDIEGITFLEQFCSAWGKTLLCISHDKRFLNTVFDQVVEIADHQLNRYKGNYDSYLDQKIAKYEQQLKEFKNQQKYMEQQEEFINRFRYKASKAAQVQSRIKMLDKVEQLDAPEDMHTAKGIHLKRSERRLPATILTIHEGVVWYENPLVHLPKKLEVTKDMQIGIMGKNGVWKTTLINSLLGENTLLQWSCKIYPTLTIGSYGQIVEAMDGTKTVLDELLGPGASMKEILGILGALSVAAEKVHQKIGSLSGGEKAKVALTKMLLTKPDVIIMDEPTNHLDILSKESIIMMLQQFTGVSLIISHDRDFLSQVANHLWLIEDQQLTVYHDVEKGFEAIG